MQNKSSHKTLIASMIANIFVFYDFSLWGYFAPILGKLFFPSSDPKTELLAAFAVFAAGFVFRPLGGIFFGYIGDKYGRKQAMVLAVLMMAIPTGLIGMMPTYQQMGISASILVVIMRMLQGVSFGGNYGGSITFTLEHTSAKKRGFVGSLTVTSCLIGIMLVSGTAAILSNLISQEALQTWGWRVLFVLGLSIYFVGLYMRQYIDESPEFLKAQISGNTTQHPLKEIFSKHKKVLSAVVLTVMTHDLSFYILFIYMTTYLTSILNLAPSTAFTINTANMFVFGVTTILGAWLSDKFGRKVIVSIFAIYLAILVVPMMKLIATEDPQMIWIAQLVLGFGAGCFFGPIPAMMVESYPTKIRFSAVALTTNISGPIFGGLTPFLMTWLINALETRTVPAYYLAAGAVISLIAVQFLKKMSIGHSLQSDQGVENLF